MRRLRPLLLLLAGLLSGLSAARADTAAKDLYLRDTRTVDRAVEILRAEAKRLGSPAVLVAFDQLTFDPPPFRSEYRYDHDYAGDLDLWLDALERWGQDVDTPILAFATRGERPVEVGDSGWRVTVRADLEAEWWAPGAKPFEPALTWIRRWAPNGKGRKRPAMLALLGNEMTPERWADPGAGQEAREPWRDRLMKVGTWWDAEAIAKALLAQRCALYVVGPEVRFGDELPRPTLPEPPWASRPQRPPPGLYGKYGADNDVAYERMLREDMDDQLKDEYPDPVERKKKVDELLGPPPWEETPGAPAAPDESQSVPTDPEESETPAWRARGGGRYTSGPPSLFPRWRGSVLFANDVPSGFGYWPYARVAARSGGRYVFYPYGESSFLDRCPRDDQALRRLAPRLDATRKVEQTLAGDTALEALYRAEALVRGGTPWSDGTSGQAASGWAGYKSVSPPQHTGGFRLRRRPSDMFLIGRMGTLEGVGRSLGQVLPSYDRALALLDDAVARAEGGKGKASPRGLANLRLGRFWFAMSAFHLETLAVCLGEIEKYVPRHFDRQGHDFIASLLPAIKMSDCYDAYDGRTLSKAEEGHFTRSLHKAWTPSGRNPEDGWWEPGQVVPGQQGNILQISPVAKEFRAKRDLSAVLKYLDPRLKKRALGMIEAGAEVMKHHAKTPWGWSVYYAEAQCFFFDPVDLGLDVRPRGGDDPPPDVPWAPTPPGGSNPGGPSSPGR